MHVFNNNLKNWRKTFAVFAPVLTVLSADCKQCTNTENTRSNTCSVRVLITCLKSLFCVIVGFVSTFIRWPFFGTQIVAVAAIHGLLSSPSAETQVENIFINSHHTIETISSQKYARWKCTMLDSVLQCNATLFLQFVAYESNRVFYAMKIKCRISHEFNGKNAQTTNLVVMSFCWIN